VKPFKFGKYLVSDPTVLVREVGPDKIWFRLHTPTPFPELGYDTRITIEARRGYGVTWLKEVFGVEDPKVIDDSKGTKA